MTGIDHAALAAMAAVVREGSFERAARMLRVTPSAISQRVKHLEERVGSVLIVRGHPCTATAIGRRLCRHAEAIAMLEQELHQSLPRLTDSGEEFERAKLRIAVNADSLDTWFVSALAPFAASEGALLDLALDDQEYTIEWLRTGQVLAAVTAASRAVQGCNSIPLGSLSYVAVTSPSFVERWFPRGVTPEALAAAPALTFNRKDELQRAWVRRNFRRSPRLPTHWLPSSQSFANASAAGMGWGMNPLPLVEAQLRSGALVEILPGRRLAVPLYWQYTRLRVPMLGRLTDAVITAARRALGRACLPAK
jgi:LysR family transcriptional regulator, chromosome initiation inhibitor